MATPTFGHLNSPRGAVQSMNWYWDEALLDWVPGTQPAAGGGGGDASAANQVIGNTSVDSIDDKTPALGQQLAAASSPVVLTAAQITTLTPPAAIAGFATSAKQDTLLTELQLKADLTETQPVSAAALPLPSGAATAARQDTLLTELQLKADLTETQPVSAVSLPLPAGAATSAKQDTGNTSLAAIDLSTTRFKLLVLSGQSAGLGNNTVLTPTSGKKLRLAYLSYGAVLASECAFRFGAAGPLFFRNACPAGGIVAKDFGELKYAEGATDEALILNLSVATTTTWNVFYTEVT